MHFCAPSSHWFLLISVLDDSHFIILKHSTFKEFVYSVKLVLKHCENKVSLTATIHSTLKRIGHYVTFLYSRVFYLSSLVMLLKATISSAHGPTSKM